MKNFPAVSLFSSLELCYSCLYNCMPLNCFHHCHFFFTIFKFLLISKMFIALNISVQTKQLQFYPQDTVTNFLMPNTMVDEDCLFSLCGLEPWYFTKSHYKFLSHIAMEAFHYYLECLHLCQLSFK